MAAAVMEMPRHAFKDMEVMDRSSRPQTTDSQSLAPSEIDEGFHQTSSTLPLDGFDESQWEANKVGIYGGQR